MARHPTSVRFTDEDQRLLERVQAELGVNTTAVLQLALRALAREMGLLSKADQQKREDEQ